MPALVDVAWAIYSNSGPAMQVITLVVVVLGYKYEIAPRLDALETKTSSHGDDLQEQELEAAERDIMLQNAHQRLDKAKDARDDLRQRLTRLEHQYAFDHGDGDADIGPAGQAGGGQ